MSPFREWWIIQRGVHRARRGPGTECSGSRRSKRRRVIVKAARVRMYGVIPSIARFIVSWSSSGWCKLALKRLKNDVCGISRSKCN
jgi:hypothetical protein